MHVLGTICGNGKFGVARNCNISLLLAQGNPKTDLTITAEENQIKVTNYLSDVLEFFAQNNVRLISRSMGGKKEEEGFDRKSNIEIMTSFCHKYNALIVNAAGNENKKIINSDEAHGLLLVANINNLGLREKTSNYGTPVFIAAPGSDIFSIDASMKDDEEHQKKIITYKGIKLIKETGTSMAIPHVSGAITAMLNVHPKLANDEIIAILRRTAIKKIGCERSETYGYGVLNAYAAIKVARYLKSGMNIDESLAKLKKKSALFYQQAMDILDLEKIAINKNSLNLKIVKKLLRKAYFSDSENWSRKDALYRFQDEFGLPSEGAALAIDLFHMTKEPSYINKLTKEEKYKLRDDLELNHRLTGAYGELLELVNKQIEEMEAKWLENLMIKIKSNHLNKLNTSDSYAPLSLPDNSLNNSLNLDLF